MHAAKPGILRLSQEVYVVKTGNGAKLVVLIDWFVSRSNTQHCLQTSFFGSDKLGDNIADEQDFIGPTVKLACDQTIAFGLLLRTRCRIVIPL